MKFSFALLTVIMLSTPSIARDRGGPWSLWGWEFNQIEGGHEHGGNGSYENGRNDNRQISCKSNCGNTSTKITNTITKQTNINDQNVYIVNDGSVNAPETIDIYVSQGNGN